MTRNVIWLEDLLCRTEWRGDICPGHLKLSQFDQTAGDLCSSFCRVKTVWCAMNKNKDYLKNGGTEGISLRAEEEHLCLSQWLFFPPDNTVSLCHQVDICPHRHRPFHLCSGMHEAISHKGGEGETSRAIKDKRSLSISWNTMFKALWREPPHELRHEKTVLCILDLPRNAGKKLPRSLRCEPSHEPMHRGLLPASSAFKGRQARCCCLGPQEIATMLPRWSLAADIKTAQKIWH